jgi:hypothetical protein
MNIRCRRTAFSSCLDGCFGFPRRSPGENCKTRLWPRIAVAAEIAKTADFTHWPSEHPALPAADLQQSRSSQSGESPAFAYTHCTNQPSNGFMRRLFCLERTGRYLPLVLADFAGPWGTWERPRRRHRSRRATQIEIFGRNVHHLWTRPVSVWRPAVLTSKPRFRPSERLERRLFRFVPAAVAGAACFTITPSPQGDGPAMEIVA